MQSNEEKVVLAPPMKVVAYGRILYNKRWLEVTQGNRKSLYNLEELVAIEAVQPRPQTQNESTKLSFSNGQVVEIDCSFKDAAKWFAPR